MDVCPDVRLRCDGAGSGAMSDYFRVLTSEHLQFLCSHPGIWMETPELPGILFGEQGQAVSFRSGKPRLLKGSRRGQYLAIFSKLGGKGYYVHQLMCQIWRGPRPAGAQVRHLDGNRLNNSVKNLVWGTPAENAADKVLHGTAPRGERNAMARLTNELVRRMRDVRRESGLSYKAIGQQFGVSTMTAYRAVTGQSWSHQ